MAANVVLGLSWGCGCINDCQTSPADPVTAGAARPRPAQPALYALLPGRAPARAAGPAVAGGHTCANAGRAAACTMGPAPRCTAARRAAASGGAFARAQAPRAGATALAPPSSTSRAGRGWWSRRAPARASCPTPPSPGASSTRPPARMPALFGAAAASRGTTVRARPRRAPRARPAWPRPRQVTHSAQLRVCALRACAAAKGLHARWTFRLKNHCRTARTLRFSAAIRSTVGPRACIKRACVPRQAHPSPRNAH